MDNETRITSSVNKFAMHTVERYTVLDVTHSRVSFELTHCGIVSPYGAM